MVHLRTIGTLIENSGIDMVWTESDLYGPNTVKQILEGNHVKRGETAHLVTLQAFFILYQEAFLQRVPESCRSRLQSLAKVFVNHAPVLRAFKWRKPTSEL